MNWKDMGKMNKTAGLILTLLLLGLTLAGCGSNITLVSKKAVTGEIAIDGSDKDWEGSMGVVPDKNMAIAAKKDDKYRYLCISTSDENLIRKIIAGGLTLWFNEDGSEAKTFGVKFPTGKMKEFGEGALPGMRGGADQPEAMEPPENMGMPGEEGTNMKKRPLRDIKFDELELYQGEDDQFPRLMGTSRAASKYNVNASASLTKGSFVYEIAIPYKNDFIELPQDTKESFFGLGLETGEVTMPSRGGMPGGSPPDDGGGFGGGMPGGSGGFGGGPGGGGPGGGGPGGMPPGGMRGGPSGSEDNSQFELWIRITDNLITK